MRGGTLQGRPANVEGHPRRWVILGVLVSAVLVVILDNTILNVALPSMERQLSASQSQQEWMVDAYTLTFAGFMFAAGVTGDRFGRRRVILAGLALFGVSSLACSLATSAYLVIAVPWEERSLERAFGESYTKYKQRVRWRIVPYIY